MFEKYRIIAGALLILAAAGPAVAMDPIGSEQVFSPYSASIIYDSAVDLAYEAPKDSLAKRKAMQLLHAAAQLDSNASYIYADILRIGSRFSEESYHQYLTAYFEPYISPSMDLHIAYSALRYLLEGYSSREGREALLKQLERVVSQKNKLLSSTVFTEYALLAAEKANFGEADKYLRRALDNDPYNELAFAKLVEIRKRQNIPINPAEFAVRLRLALANNPMDFSIALSYAEYCERIQLYDYAASAYEYASTLYNYLNPGAAMPSFIYLPWAVTAYNTSAGGRKCIEIAGEVRSQGKFDLILESIAASAALKTGYPGSEKMMRELLETVEEKAGSEESSGNITPEALAWFYSFVKQDNEKALAWANRAYSQDPNSSAVVSLFAYTLAIDGRTDTASELISGLDEEDQVASLALARIFLGEDKIDPAIEKLKSTVEMDPSSLLAEKAKLQLELNGSRYMPPAQPETYVQRLKTAFGQEIVPKFKTIEEIISAKLNFGSNEFNFGMEINPSLIVINKSNLPMVINDFGLWKGGIRVDVEVSGDINLTFENYFNRTIRPSAIIEPGQHAAVSLPVIVGRLRRLLDQHPQAKLDLTFTLYLDPRVTDDGEVVSGVPYLAPITQTIRRAPLKVTASYIMQRLETLSNGTVGQKSRIVDLFTSMLAEQYAFQGRKPLYKYTYLENQILVDAVRRSLLDEEWTIRLKTIDALLPISGYLSYDAIADISANLDHEKWPVRMMAMYLLADIQGDNFKPVLDWTAESDSKDVVRRMAVTLGGDLPEDMQPLGR